MESRDDILEYISIYCTQFYNEKEKAASQHYTAQVKLLPYKDKLKKVAESYKRLTSSDAEVLSLLKNGYIEFKNKAAERIYSEHFDELYLNKCPKCGGIARTPQALQCRYCEYDWH
jgi:hypothetical protein